MGYKNLQLKIRTNYTEQELADTIKKMLGFADFKFTIEKKSLDARKKNDIHWLINVMIEAKSIKVDEQKPAPNIEIRRIKKQRKAVVVGSGPAGFFAAHTLQLSGYETIIIERGSTVEERTKSIRALDQKGQFDSSDNYAFGEGGAGTFSDGKLTSRSKSITAERWFILNEYVNAGAPKEILYMAHPHIGTDNLKIVVANLRKTFIENGGQIIFKQIITDLETKKGKVSKLTGPNFEIEADLFIFATGHSAYETYRMLIDRGVVFKTKNFAIGHRIEHMQHMINHSQWGVDEIAGVKAAEYRLAHTSQKGMPVYTFCMCPGGTIVPAAAYEQKSVVNGMSYYSRNGQFANAGCVAGVHPDTLIGHKAKPIEILDWMDKLEEQFYHFRENLVIPTAFTADYLKKKTSKFSGPTSYQLGGEPAPLHRMVPEVISNALIEGIKNFASKLRGFDTGMLLGLESKTSSPIQVEREKNGKCIGFDNLYMVGEGSGYSGGIISSAADGLKCAMEIIETEI